MEIVGYIFGGLILIGISFAVGRLTGFLDAQPKRGKDGRFEKKD